jgi:hypothetical protein
MEAIVYHNGVYMFVMDNSKELSENIPDEEIVVSSNIADKKLVGGRIRLAKNGARLYVDGIEIQTINCDDYGKITFIQDHPKDSVCAFLNQIEMLGVDTFLENYKQSLLNAKSSYEDLANKIETNISISPDRDDLKRRLIYINEFLHEVICIVFILTINMNAGMDNHVYSDSFSEFINLYTK